MVFFLLLDINIQTRSQYFYAIIRRHKRLTNDDSKPKKKFN